MPRKSILITGGGGFIAPHLIRGLGSRWNVIVHIRNMQKAMPIEAGQGLRFISGPLAEEYLVRQIPEPCETVFHLAGAVSGPDTGAIIDSNVVSTCNILSLMKRKRIPNLIFLSTASVWAGSAGSSLNEEVEPQPSTLYGYVKLAAERLIRDAFVQQQLASAVILRGNNTYGPGSIQGVVANFYSCLINGHPVQIDGDGQQLREPLFVTDLVDVLIKSLAVDKGFHIYGISGPETLTVLQMAETLAGALGQKLQVDWRPVRTDRSRDLVIDTGKVQRELGWVPRIRFNEGGKRLAKAAMRPFVQ